MMIMTSTLPYYSGYFPKFIPGHYALSETYHLPKLVRQVYLQTIRAIQEMREYSQPGAEGYNRSYMQRQEYSGANLEVRITRLASQGLISRRDAERLHGIRF
jgi:hypothetical protein